MNFSSITLATGLGLAAACSDAPSLNSGTSAAVQAPVASEADVGTAAFGSSASLNSGTVISVEYPLRGSFTPGIADAAPVDNLAGYRIYSVPTSRGAVMRQPEAENTCPTTCATSGSGAAWDGYWHDSRCECVMPVATPVARVAANTDSDHANVSTASASSAKPAKGVDPALAAADAKLMSALNGKRPMCVSTADILDDYWSSFKKSMDAKFSPPDTKRQ